MIKVHSKDSGTLGSIKLTVNSSSIIEFTLIDDKDKDLTQEEVIKYVNLPVFNKFVDASNGTITGTHQLGDDIWCRIKFRKPGKYIFDIFLENDDAIVYTQLEKDRNENFTHTRTRKIIRSTDSTGEVLVKGDELFLSQAGGNTYTLKVECNGEDQVICKTKILTKRMLFYSEIKMRNSDGSGFLSSIKNDIFNLVTEFKSHHIEFVESFEAIVEYMPNIDRTLQESFIKDVESAYTNNPDNKNIDPFCLTITYADQLAVKGSLDLFDFDVPVGPGAAPVMIDVTGNYTEYESLWHKIDYPDELDRNEWYIYCTYKMINNTNGVIVLSNSILIPPDKCTPLSIDAVSDNCCVISIDVSDLPVGLADISLKVHTVSMMRVGLSFSGTNIICLCTKVWWGVIPVDEQNITLIHEVGHTVGMVPDGTGTCLDMGANYYADRGHIGPHCHSGISTNITTKYTSANSSSATCIMYGSISSFRNQFCTDCSSQIKKLDLSRGINI